MNDIDSDDPSLTGGPASGASPTGPVPENPVAHIEIFGNVVSVNGVVIVHDGTQSLHHVAVRAAAERVARPLGRPVRAEATDSEGRARFVVHPDGHASDVELLESFDSEDDALAAVAAAPTRQAVGPPPVGPPPVSTPPVSPPLATRTPSAAAPVAVRPASGAPAGWPSKVVRMVALAAALVAVVGMGVLLLANHTESTSAGARNTTPEPTAPVAAASPAEVPTTAAPVAPTTPSASGSTDPVLSVDPLAGTGALRLTIALDSAGPDTPVSAEVFVRSAGQKAVRRTVTLDSASTEVSVGNLPGGPASWRVRVEGLPVQKGKTAILGPYVAPTSAPAPVAPAAPAVPAVPVAPAPPPAPQPDAKPQPKPKPAPKAKPKPKSKSAIKGKSKLKGS